MNLPPILLFVLVGGFSSAVNFVARILIDRVTSYETAIVIAFPIALTTAFLLNRLLVFQETRREWKDQYVRFLIVNLIALVQVFAVSLLLARWLFPAIGMNFHPDTVAHGIALVSPLPTSYWLHKHFSFADRTPGARGAPVARDIRG